MRDGLTVIAGHDYESLHMSIRAYLAERLELMNLLLYGEATELADEATKLIGAYAAKNVKAGGLALVVRYRQGQWGPRIVWIRIGRPIEYRVATRKPTGGQVPRETREVAMPTGTAAHLNTFRNLEEPLRTELRNIEIRARRLRRVTAKYRKISIQINADVDAVVADGGQFED